MQKARPRRDDVKHKTPRVMRSTPSQYQHRAQCPDANVCMNDKNGACTTQGYVLEKGGILQLATDNATNFTSLSRFYSHTCVNWSRPTTHTSHASSLMFSTAHHAVPLFRLRSTLLNFQKQSILVTVLVQTFDCRTCRCESNQIANLILFEVGEPQGGKFPTQLRVVPLRSSWEEIDIQKKDCGFSWRLFVVEEEILVLVVSVLGECLEEKCGYSSSGDFVSHPPFQVS